jgi:hypothetical protein
MYLKLWEGRRCFCHLTLILIRDRETKERSHDHMTTRFDVLLKYFVTKLRDNFDLLVIHTYIHTYIHVCTRKEFFFCRKRTTQKFVTAINFYSLIQVTTLRSPFLIFASLI